MPNLGLDANGLQLAEYVFSDSQFEPTRPIGKLFDCVVKHQMSKTSSGALNSCFQVIEATLEDSDRKLGESTGHSVERGSGCTDIVLWHIYIT